MEYLQKKSAYSRFFIFFGPILQDQSLKKELERFATKAVLNGDFHYGVGSVVVGSSQLVLELHLAKHGFSFEVERTKKKTSVVEVPVALSIKRYSRC